MNHEVTDIACEGLNQLELGDKRLVVQRASVGSNKAAMSSQTTTGLASVAAALPNLISKAPAQPSTVVQLLNMVSPEELLDDEEYEDILEDVKSECRKFGTIVDIVIPRPTPEVPHSPAIGKVSKSHPVLFSLPYLWKGIQRTTSELVRDQWLTFYVVTMFGSIFLCLPVRFLFNTMTRLKLRLRCKLWLGESLLTRRF